MKIQVINIDSSKSDCLIIKDGLGIVNINALIKRYNLDKNYIGGSLKSIIPTINKINFTNLASLCYKIGLDYRSNQCLELVERLVRDFRSLNPNLIFVQNGITNQGETDMLPFESLFDIDTKSDTLYLNKILKDKLRMLGYADSQFTSLLLSFNKIDKLLPKDMLEDVAMCSDSNIIAYNKIKEVLY